jgi:hypothetical protein
VRDGQAMQRAQGAALDLELIGGLGAGACAVGHQRDDGVHPGVHALDAREVGVHDFACRELLAADARREVDRGEIADLVAGDRRGWSGLELSCERGAPEQLAKGATADGVVRRVTHRFPPAGEYREAADLDDPAPRA